MADSLAVRLMRDTVSERMGASLIEAYSSQIPLAHRLGEAQTLSLKAGKSVSVFCWCFVFWEFPGSSHTCQGFLVLSQHPRTTLGLRAHGACLSVCALNVFVPSWASPCPFFPRPDDSQHGVVCTPPLFGNAWRHSWLSYWGWEGLLQARGVAKLPPMPRTAFLPIQHRIVLP